MALPGSPVNCAVTPVVHHTKIPTFLGQNLDNVQLPQASSNVDGTFTVFVGLIDIDVCHGQQLVQTFPIVFFDSTKYGGQNEIVTLKRRTYYNFKYNVSKTMALR